MNIIDQIQIQSEIEQRSRNMKSMLNDSFQKRIMDEQIELWRENNLTDEFDFRMSKALERHCAIKLLSAYRHLNKNKDYKPKYERKQLYERLRKEVFENETI